jgi:hypothetical protein
MKVIWKKEKNGKLKSFHISNYWKGKGDYLLFIIPNICVSRGEKDFEISLDWLFWSIMYQSIKV